MAVSSDIGARMRRRDFIVFFAQQSANVVALSSASNRLDKQGETQP
jgi:hypothetical protein